MPVTAHPGHSKAFHYFDIDVLKAPVTADYVVDVDFVREHIGPSTVALVGSAGTYPHGLIDPIEELGKLVADVESIGEQFAQYVLVNWLRHDTLRRLRWHQSSGHRIVIVSASLAAYLRPMARRLGIDDVLCTDSMRSGDRYGDRLDGPNCRAAEKRRRFDQWLADQRWVDTEVWAYGDSAGDRELLERADHAVWVDGETISEAPEVVAG